MGFLVDEMALVQGFSQISSVLPCHCQSTNAPYLIPVAERAKARVCGRSLAGVAGSNPAGGMDVCFVCVTQ